jgi:small GTP-binding protein
MEQRYKVIFVGDSSVGKTCLARRIVHGSFDEFTVNTIGSALLKYTHKNDNGKEIGYEIWDTAGQENYRSIVPMFFKNASFVCIIYSISDRKTFESLGAWVDLVKDNCPGVNFLLIGNKSDIPDREVTFEESAIKGKEFKALDTIECSALTGHQVDLIFQIISGCSLAPSEEKESTVHIAPSSEEDAWKTKKSGCC